MAAGSSTRSVSDLQNFAGEHLLPVIHQRAVVSELLADPFEVVREPHFAVPHRVFDEVVGDCDVARIATHGNDPRVRKEQFDQPDVLEVVGQLVHHVIGIGGIFAELVQYAFGNASADLWIEVVHTIGITAPGTDVTLPALEPGDHAWNRAQLTGTVDATVPSRESAQPTWCRSEAFHDEYRQCCDRSPHRCSYSAFGNA